jgi:hypothetical protein
MFSWGEGREKSAESLDQIVHLRSWEGAFLLFGQMRSASLMARYQVLEHEDEFSARDEVLV